MIGLRMSRWNSGKRKGTFSVTISKSKKKIHELLRFSTAGSVDDGKSTLIGRLLFDSKSLFEDQLRAVERSTRRKGQEGVDLAMLTDGLSAEREQGITIDVAYRYFATPKREFIIADTPGHEQYTRNMVTGASTADLSLVLIDARKGMLSQSKRHAYISALLGIKYLMVCVNKMDLVNFSEETFKKIQQEFRDFAQTLSFKEIQFIPISALLGDNVVNKSPNMPWYKDRPILEILENIQIIPAFNPAGLRFPVQYVNRAHADFRGYAGTVAGGLAKTGQDIVVLPSQKKTKIKNIVAYDGELKEALPSMAVTLTLEDEIDISRGDMIVSTKNLPVMTKDFQARICWMDEEPLQVRKKYIIKHLTNTRKAMITEIHHVVDIDSLEEVEGDVIRLNEIALVQIKVMNPLFLDPYSINYTTGSFIIIDEVSHNTVAAGMVV